MVSSRSRDTGLGLGLGTPGLSLGPPGLGLGLGHGTPGLGLGLEKLVSATSRHSLTLRPTEAVFAYKRDHDTAHDLTSCMHSLGW